MRFLLDMNLPPALAGRLREAGHDAIHALDAGQGRMQDREIFTNAANDNRIVVTFDLDFGEIAGAAVDAKSSVILLRLRLGGQQYLWDRLQVTITEAGAALAAGAIVLVEDARIRIRRVPPGEPR